MRLTLFLLSSLLSPDLGTMLLSPDCDLGYCHSVLTQTTDIMLPFGGGGGRIGRARMRLDEMDCADIMRKAVQRKRSRSIARRESFSGTEDDLRKFREAVESNDKDSDLQKDIEEYAVKVRELRGGEGLETAKAQDTSNDAETKHLESKPLIQKVEDENQPPDNNISDVNIKSEPSTEENINKEPSDSLNTDDKVKSYEHTSTSLSTEENVQTEEETSTGLDTEEKIVSYEESSTSRNTEEEIQPCADVTSKTFEEKEEVIQDLKAPEICNSVEEETFDDRSLIYDDEKIDVAEKANKEEELTPEKVNCIDEYCNEGQNLVDVHEIPVSEEHETVEETVLEISTPNEERAIVVDIYQEIEAEDVTKECVEKGEDELNEIQETDADPNETRDHTDKIEDMTENMEQIPSALVESGGDTEEITPRKEETRKDCKEILDQQDTGASEFVTTESTDNYEAEPDQIQPDLEFIASDNKEEIDEGVSEVTEYTENVTDPADVDTLEGESTEDVTAADATTPDCPDKPSCEPDGFLSIVDRIKNDITTLKTISKEGAITAEKTGHNGEVPSSEESPLAGEMDGEPKQSGLKVALDRVSREKSASHVQIPQELSSHLISLSSANISEQLRKSCSNIVARYTQNSLIVSD